TVLTCAAPLYPPPVAQPANTKPAANKTPRVKATVPFILQALPSISILRLIDKQSLSSKTEVLGKPLLSESKTER
ncbi:MAG: hypothetical protein LBP20_04610, partial [Treponema sp.]|nr:hypothetical protein [Treponema sp.]